MTWDIKTTSKIFRLWPALLLFAGIGFSASLLSAESQQEIDKGPVDQTEKPLPENDRDQDAEKPATPDDFKPSEEISEDFPVPLPSDI